MAVSKEEMDWESTIELVLSGFARSLLVPNLHYARVSAYVDATRMTDAGGRGQRLVYLHVAPKSQARSGRQNKRDTLWNKLVFRSEHPLAAWVEQEVLERFDYLACDSMEEFQQARQSAMTRNRHVKAGGSRHEKTTALRQIGANMYSAGTIDKNELNSSNPCRTWIFASANWKVSRCSFRRKSISARG